jgi:fructosamine-3-kinase
LASAESDAAALLADLHDITPAGGHFGFEFDTLIGPLPQPNPWTPSWPVFFREHRLIAMVSLCRNAGELPASIGTRVEALARRLEELLPAKPSVSLVHGDVWSGNVLSQGNRVTAFLDPSLSFSHAEVELAFIALFSTFGTSFYKHYDQRRQIEPGFLKSRKDIYNLYPLLVHTRLFGSTYLPQVDACLRRLGF